MKTCLSCGDKFPGDPCKKCGADPNVIPTLDQKIVQVKMSAERLTTGMRRLGKVTRQTVKQMQTPEQRHHSRKRQRALVRSLENTRSSGSHVKHGRRGVR